MTAETGGFFPVSDQPVRGCRVMWCMAIKTGISAVSKEGAKLNFESEIKDKEFSEIRKNAEKEWETELNKIEVKGGSKKQKTIFYTALYHSFIAPNLFHDVDGKYRGTDLKVHHKNH